VSIDDVEESTSQVQQGHGQYAYYSQVVIAFLKQSLDADEHTVKIRWKQQAGLATMHAYQRTLRVVELNA